MKTTIVIDDVDAATNPAYPWTANAYNEDGELLSNPGFGMSRHDAVTSLLENIGLEMPAFWEPLIPQLDAAQAHLVAQARALLGRNGGSNETQRTYQRAVVELVDEALGTLGIEDSDDHRMVVERMLRS